MTSDKISDFSNSNNNNSDDSDSSTDDSIVYNLQSLLSITKPMFFKNVENKDIFDYTFYTRWTLHAPESAPENKLILQALSLGVTYVVCLT